MTNLEVEHCEACEGNVSLMSDEAIKQQLDKLKGWHYDETQKRLSKTFEFKGFYKTMGFVNAVAWIANTEKHHPDLEVSYNQCVVHYQTHAAGGVTNNDLICVRKIEALLL